MPSAEMLQGDILKAEQEAEHKRNFERSKAATLQQQNQASLGRRAAGGAVKAAGSGLSLAGDAANAVPIVGGALGAPLNAAGSGLKRAGNAIGGANVAGNAANDLVDEMLPGSRSIRALMDDNLPPLLRLMVAGKELTKPSFMLLWPFFGPLYCFFTIGTLLARTWSGSRVDGEPITDQDVHLEATDRMTFSVSFILILVMIIIGGALFGTVMK